MMSDEIRTMRDRFLGGGTTQHDLGLTTYQSCAHQVEEQNSQAMMECIAGTIDRNQGSSTQDLVDWLLVVCGSMIFFMQAGFAMLCAGSVRKKNVQNTMLKNLLDACGASLAFFSVGFAFAFGGQDEIDEITFVGHKNFFGTGKIDQGFWFFQYAFSATAGTIIAGTLAERCQMAAYLCYSLYITSFVYPVVAHAIWSNNGFLSPFSKDPFRGIGVIDFAGCAVVHLTGGTIALIATYILGARKGRFHDNNGRLLPTPRTIRGHSIALQLMGTMVLWFGWYGFNAGSALLLPVSETGNVAARASVNTSLAAAAGCCTSLFINLAIVHRKTGEYKFDLLKAMTGTLGALASITGSCGVIENWAALMIGFIAGLLYLVGSYGLVKFRLDDAVDAIPVHMVNGIWGTLATGLLASPGGMMEAFGTDEYVGFFYSLGRGSLDATMFGNQCIGILFVVSWVIFTTLPFFLLLNYMGWFRADSLQELMGLDLACLGRNLDDSGVNGDFSEMEGDESVCEQGMDDEGAEEEDIKKPSEEVVAPKKEVADAEQAPAQPKKQKHRHKPHSHYQTSGPHFVSPDALSELTGAD